jgi:hypothetical protein
MGWTYFDVQMLEFPEKALADFFIEQVKRRSILVLVVGEKGAGKSYAVGKLCELISPVFNGDAVATKIEDVKRIILRQVSDLKRPYGVLNMDDFGSELDPNDFASTVAKEASHLFQKDRKFNIMSFLTVPNQLLINKNFRERLVDYKIEVIGHDERTGYTELKLHRVQVNQSTGKTYRHRLFFDRRHGRVCVKPNPYTIPLSIIKLRRPSRGFINWYEPQRTQIGLDQLKNKEKPQQEVQVDRVQQIMDEIKADPSKGFKVWRGKRIIDKALIRGKFKVGVSTADTIAAMMNPRE